jgi:hypothetical protein
MVKFLWRHKMGYRSAKISVGEIEEILPTLSRGEIIELDQKIHSYLETSFMTRAAETAFSEWEDLEEDLYNADV